MMVNISPFDTLSFGTGKPSVRGEDTFGIGMFPPFPSVFYGAFRSLYFSEHIDELSTANMNNDPTRQFIIDYYSLSYKTYGDSCCMFPAPFDMAAKKNEATDEKNRLYHLRLIENDGLSSISLPYCLWLDIEGEAPSKAFIRHDELQGYLERSGDRIYKTDITEMITEEHKTGIYRDRTTRTAGTGDAEGMLYRTSMVRMEMNRDSKISFQLGLKNSEGKLPEDGLLRLGSHGKAARYKKVDCEVVLGAVPDNDRFKLYFSTSAIFENGWLPKWLHMENSRDAADITGELSGYGVRLLAATVPGYECCGGFDIKKNRPKPMRRAVPAGSVYYFELMEKGVKNRKGIFDALNGTSISDERANEGFGIVYMGKV